MAESGMAKTMVSGIDRKVTMKLNPFDRTRLTSPFTTPPQSIELRGVFSIAREQNHNDTIINIFSSIKSITE
ncbi:unnamed protein product [Lactuca virosa]|uniref:Uncharacterized protein n=1 Tax=Lactuca virosa TaxID=75947 RepID=A0AAU9PMS9_9ASTR|nr:unnamed protein product [Lactuca virosa]